MNRNKSIGIGLLLVLLALIWYWLYETGNTATTDTDNNAAPDEYGGENGIELPNDLEVWQQNSYASKIADDLYNTLKEWGDNTKLSQLLDNLIFMQPDTLLSVIEYWNVKYNNNGKYPIDIAIASEWCYFTGLNCNLRDQAVAYIQQYTGNNTDVPLFNWQDLS
jgi:hypothetical protein